MSDQKQQTFLLRGEVSSLIEKRIEALDKGYRQNLGLISPAGFGKTYLFEQLYQILAFHAGFIPVYVDCNIIDFEHLVDRWAGGLLAGVFKNQGLETSSNFHSLLLTADLITPKTTEKIRTLKKTLRREKSSALFKELYALTEVLAQETGKKIVLMMDEFDRLQEAGAGDPFSSLAREVMVQKNTLYILSSSSPVHAREIFHEKLSMLFGNFEVLELNPFDFDDALKFTESRLEDLKITRAQHQFLIRLTDGNPHYLSLILSQIKSLIAHHRASEDSSLMRVEREIPDSMMIDALYREIYPGQGRLALQFESRLLGLRLSGKEAGSCLRILIAISQGKRRVNAIATAIDRKIQDTKKLLARLIEKDFVQRQGSFYTISDPLFRFYLREVLDRRNHNYEPCQEEFQREMLNAFSKEMEKAQAEASHCYAQRLENLFKEFRNDTLELQNRRFLCPQFTEVQLRTRESHMAVLAAKNPKLRWHCQLHYEKISEDDVVLFLEEIKKYRKKPQQRVFVLLRGIDQNAKLMAQEAGIQLWDLRIINGLLDLYDLPKIIIVADKEIYGSNVGALAQSIHTA